MADRPKIPIKNIYYMLCYAWNTLQRADAVLTGFENFDNIYNLLAKLMIHGVSGIIKRGFHREYVTDEVEFSLVRGKINLGSSIKQHSLTKRRLICEFDEFSCNVPFNQILKSTICTLIKCPHLNPELKKELIDIRYHFSNIDEIRITLQTFSLLRYNRNNMNYKILMNICELIYRGLITNEEDNILKFADFIRNEQMSNLYEKFVLNFYKKHLPSSQHKTYSPKIEWGIDSDFDHIGLEYLPQMRTDIVVENDIDKTQTIIDTKYYASALDSRNYSETKKLISGNLYQICTYVNNSPYSGTVSGMLLYPTTKQELNLEYKINGKIIKVKTLDLSGDWEDIADRLMDIVS